MNRLERLIHEVRTAWPYPRLTSGDRGNDSFLLTCTISDRMQAVQSPFPFEVPPDVLLFWSLVEHADLFKDIHYGQWGLALYGAEAAFAASEKAWTTRSDDFLASDIVIGSFYGDSDLLFVCCEVGEQFGSVGVALPIDRRRDWYAVSDSLIAFLEEYVRAEGDKFWE